MHVNGAFGVRRLDGAFAFVMRNGEYQGKRRQAAALQVSGTFWVTKPCALASKAARTAALRLSELEDHYE
jgi:hypothetical protein